MSDYDRIARAIAYLEANVSAQPQLDAVARHVHLSPFHFQRLFTRWAGTTPKRFLQVLTLELGKQLLQQGGSLLEVTDQEFTPDPRFNAGDPKYGGAVMAAV